MVCGREVTSSCFHAIISRFSSLPGKKAVTASGILAERSAKLVLCRPLTVIDVSHFIEELQRSWTATDGVIRVGDTPQLRSNLSYKWIAHPVFPLVGFTRPILKPVWIITYHNPGPSTCCCSGGKAHFVIRGKGQGLYYKYNWESPMLIFIT